MNKIDKNFTHGIMSKTHEEYRCDAHIKSNLSISGNKEHGIICTGDKNHSKIEDN